MESAHSYTEGVNEYDLSDPLMHLELSEMDALVALCALMATSAMEDEPVQSNEDTNETPSCQETILRCVFERI